MYDKSHATVKADASPKFTAEGALDYGSDRIMAALAELASKVCERRPEHVFRLCESPIEKSMLLALWARFCWPSFMQGTITCPTEFDAALRASHMRPVIAPQVEIGGYRVDIMIGFRGDGDTYRIAVECDGHDFHEKTKAQAARDKSRDRALMERGILVLRFTGSEIWNDLAGCAHQVHSIVESELVDRLHRDHVADASGASNV